MNYRAMSKAELIQLLELREKPVECKNPKSVYDYLRRYGREAQEHFLVVLLDGAHKIKYVKVVSIGLVNRTLVHPREVFAVCIEHRATACIIAHNHPSGNLEPSADDLEVTMRLRKAGLLLGIEVLDHLIFSDSGYHSMAECGELLS